MRISEARRRVKKLLAAEVQIEEEVAKVRRRYATFDGTAPESVRSSAGIQQVAETERQRSGELRRRQPTELNSAKAAGQERREVQCEKSDRVNSARE
jgi:hypothetical protein